MGYLYAASLVLLLRVWENALSGTVSLAVGEFEHIQKALRVLEAFEVDWHIAARYRDILRDLMATAKPCEDAYAARSHHYAFLPLETQPLPRRASSGNTQGSAQAAAPSGSCLDIPVPLPSRGGVHAPAISGVGAHPPLEPFPISGPELDSMFAQLLPAGEHDARAILAEQCTLAVPLDGVDDESAAELQQTYVAAYPQGWDGGLYDKTAHL